MDPKPVPIVERPAPKPASLMTPEAWQNRHLRDVRGPSEPRPGRRHLDFELGRFFDRHLSDRGGATILEAGCGSSVWLPPFVRRFGLTATGLDLSAAGLEICRRNLDRAAVAAELIRGDLLDRAALSGRSFDIVYSLGVLEHFVDPAAVIGCMSGFLKPGGLFLAWVPNPSGMATRLSRRLDREYDRTHHSASRAQWIAWLRGAGLIILETYPAQFLDFSHLHLLGFPAPVRRILGLAFRALSLPFLGFERAFDVRIGIGPLCSGLFLAAQKPRSENKPR